MQTATESVQKCDIMSLHSGWETPCHSCTTAPLLPLPTVDPDSGTGPMSASGARAGWYGCPLAGIPSPGTGRTPPASCDRALAGIPSPGTHRTSRAASQRSPTGVPGPGVRRRSMMSPYTWIRCLSIGSHCRLLAACAVTLSTLLSLAAPRVHAQDWDGSVEVSAGSHGRPRRRSRQLPRQAEQAAHPGRMVDHPARRRRHARRRRLQRHHLGAVGRLAVRPGQLGPVARDHHQVERGL